MLSGNEETQILSSHSCGKHEESNICKHSLQESQVIVWDHLICILSPVDYNVKDRSARTWSIRITISATTEELPHAPSKTNYELTEVIGIHWKLHCLLRGSNSALVFTEDDSQIIKRSITSFTILLSTKTLPQVITFSCYARLATCKH